MTVGHVIVLHSRDKWIRQFPTTKLLAALAYPTALARSSIGPAYLS